MTQRFVSIWLVLQLLQHCFTTVTAVASRKQYAMYVWTTGFDHTIPGCNEQKFLAWDKTCLSHVWDTEAKRQWLWNTCNVPGREVAAIFLSDLHHNLRDAYNRGDCKLSSIQWVRETLAQGHSKVPDLKIYALYAVSDLAVSEKDLVKYVVYYNDACAVSAAERLDGVATNNEAYASIKCGDMSTRLQYLNDLYQITVEAGKQKSGKLLTHYSVSWHWGRCNSKPSLMTWNGTTSDVVHHMIDIFDSVDVQVGYIIFPQISDRVKIAGYDYARSRGKTIYVTVYTNKGSLCQTTFFPSNTCHIGDHTEAGMFDKFDRFSANSISEARPCIHYFRGIYSSGGNADWPVHNPKAQKCRRWKRKRLFRQKLSGRNRFSSFQHKVPA